MALGREAGWAGEAERRPLVSMSAQVVRGAGQVFALGWWGWKLCFLLHLGIRSSECGQGGSVPWLPIYRVLKTTGEPSSRKLVSHLANTTPPSGKMQFLRFQLDNLIVLKAIFPKAGVSPWGAVVKM